MSADYPDAADSFAIEPGRERWLRLVRNKKQRERYGPAHLRRRREFAQRLEAGEILRCPRCDGELDSDSVWELDHDDINPAWSQPAHKSCNRRAANQCRTSRVW
jgi:hypothetical protein